MKHFFLITTFASLTLPVFAIDYKQDVLPIMKEHCFECHAGAKAKGNLNLENLDEMRESQVGKFNIIRPGNSEESSFLEKMNLPEDDTDFMPRKGSKLPNKDLETIAKWIKEGAVIDASNPGEKEQEWVKKGGGTSGGGDKKAAPSQEFIKWTSSDNKVIEARFLGLQGEAVKLLMKNGQAYTVPFARLSSASVTTAREMAGKTAVVAAFCRNIPSLDRVQWMT